MARKKAAKGAITEADIAAFRSLIEFHRQAHIARIRLAKKLGCDFFDLDEWADRLGARSSVTDADVCFAMGRLTYDE